MVGLEPLRYPKDKFKSGEVFPDTGVFDDSLGLVVGSQDF